MPIELGEVAGGVIRGVLYLVGEGPAETATYDAQSGQWKTNAAQRPFTGHHHAAEVVNNKLYLLGGLGHGSNGKLQIYDPQTNMWSRGRTCHSPRGPHRRQILRVINHLQGPFASTWRILTSTYPRHKHFVAR